MTSYCDVANPTRHLEPMLESCKVGIYSYRMYDDVNKYKDRDEDNKNDSLKQLASQNQTISKSLLMQ
mgnify:CR=1 FL=1